MEKQKLFINGNWEEGIEYEELRSPYNQDIIGMIPLATKEQVENAIVSAQQASKPMRNLTSFERAEILEKVSNLFTERLEECALIIASENAKPLKAARAEIIRTAETYKFAAEEAKRLHGETVPLDAAKSGKGRFGYTKREPLGVIAAITPFNFPFNLVAHKLGPAFAAGNTVVLKPASQTPLSAIMTAKLFEEAGLPKGALNVVTGKGSIVGDILVQDHRVKMITFTGSVPVGTRIKEKAGLKRVTLELGSNAAVIIDSTDDLETTAARCAEGAFNFAGQVCISVQRIYVNEYLFEEFIEKMKHFTSKLILGNPKSEDTDVSALIHSHEMVRIENWVKEAEEAGAKVVLGGKRVGAVFQPTILENTAENLAISCNEAFGPVVSVNSYKSWDEAIKLVNDSEYGLQAGVYTTNIQKAFEAADRLEVGGVIINDIPTFRVDNMPYGGVKNSGVGKEGIKYSTEEMTELKFVSFKL
ncbi:aldehyde dehydrogenase family protein [Bacillus sp. JJ1562]|uniref:aldehyde dehydrogenase family protein n=1 Tax=Bacillus sp. JJ1562 TaxID=3122960 RepID=UPI0030011053